MIVNKKGDLLKSDDCMAILHQTNTLGCMGGGIAKQIREYWCKEVYEPYRRVCLDNINTTNLLGKIQVLKTNEKPIEYVINLFGEISFGRNNAPFPNGRHTDYDALRTCLLKVKKWCMEKNVLSVGMPKYLGCGLAGGDWDGVVYPMIEEIFGGDEIITLNVYEFYVPPFADVKPRKLNNGLTHKKWGAML